MKHAPIRTCLGCRTTRPKSELVRLVRRADGRVVVAPNGSGRGAYVCAEPSCLAKALKGGRLGHAFRAACRVDADLEQRVLAVSDSGTPATNGATDDRGTPRRSRGGPSLLGSGGHFGTPSSMGR